MPENAIINSIANHIITVPEEKYAPDPKKKPSYLREIPNYADDEDIVRNTLEWTRNYYNTFIAQGQRKAIIDSMDLADELYRAAVDRSMLVSKEKTNIDATKSKIHSATYYSDQRAIVANQKSMVLGVEETLPIKYEPIPGSAEYSDEEGRKISDYQDVLLAYTWEVAQMDKAIGKELWRLNKYGNSVIEMMWDYRVQTLPKKEPVFKRKMFGLGPEDRSQIIKYKWVTKELVIADWPVLVSYDMKDVYFDSMIDETQDQSCIIFRMQKQLSDIWVLQRTGEYMNVGKIKGEHQYQGEGTSTVKADRQENADEIQDSQLPNTLFDVWRAWIRLPINPDNGKWEPEKVLPSWHIVTFVGDLDSRQCICTKISPNPNSCGQIPVSINHALEDDKGAFHLGFQDLTKSYLAMEMTLFDLALDNARIRNRVPLLAERNSVMIRDKTFTAGGNQIITYKAGTKEPTEMKVQDTTVSTVPLLGQVEDRRERVQGTGPAFRGEAIGGRQSASGYLGTLDQAMKPAIEDAKYVTFQILPFVGFWVKEMWSDFGDPERKIIVTMQDELREVKPMYIWGDLKIRVTSIKNFQDNALKRREMDEVLTKIVPVMVQTGAATGESLKPLFSEYLRDKHINNVDEIFNTKNNTMQIRQARFENMSILWGGGQEMPSEEDDHKVHIKEHEPYTATIEMLQEGSRPPDASIAKMKEHTQMHKYFLERGQTGQGMPQAQQQQQPNEPASVPTPGEVSGDNLAGGMGTFGNLETASTGRPPMISETQQGGMM